MRPGLTELAAAFVSDGELLGLRYDAVETWAPTCGRWIRRLPLDAEEDDPRARKLHPKLDTTARWARSKSF
jgi:hypothetical protein